jgi:hypothetical protein
VRTIKKEKKEKGDRTEKKDRKERKEKKCRSSKTKKEEDPSELSFSAANLAYHTQQQLADSQNNSHSYRTRDSCTSQTNRSSVSSASNAPIAGQAASNGQPAQIGTGSKPQSRNNSGIFSRIFDIFGMGRNGVSSGNNSTRNSFTAAQSGVAASGNRESKRLGSFTNNNLPPLPPSTMSPTGATKSTSTTATFADSPLPSVGTEASTRKAFTPNTASSEHSDSIATAADLESNTSTAPISTIPIVQNLDTGDVFPLGVLIYEPQVVLPATVSPNVLFKQDSEVTPSGVESKQPNEGDDLTSS